MWADAVGEIMLTLTDKLVVWMLTAVLAVCTIFFNMYLLLIIQRSYRKKHKLNPCDFIISAIALACIFQQVLAYLWQTIDEIDIVCRIDFTAAVILVLIFSLKIIIFWSTAFLTFYYGTKLVVEPVHCYTCIQEAIIKHVHTVLAVIIICGFANCVPMFTILTPYNTTSGLGDCGSIMPNDNTEKAYIFYYVLISDIIPGAIMAKSSISIAYHLAKHLLDMKASTNGTHGPKLGTQMRVIKMTLSLVAVFLCFVVVDVYTQSTVVLLKQNSLCLIILFGSLYSAVSAGVMIYGKESYWKEMIASYNIFLDEYPCLNSLKISEVNSEPHAHH